jgi:hypothetical protein
MIKDYKPMRPDSPRGKDIETHLKVFERLGVGTNLRLYKKFRAPNFSVQDGHLHARWATYCSVWHHDIAFGGGHGSSGPFYIVEPNTGLLGYSSSDPFIADLNDYIAGRRTRKNKPANEPAGFWVYF